MIAALLCGVVGFLCGWSAAPLVGSYRERKRLLATVDQLRATNYELRIALQPHMEREAMGGMHLGPPQWWGSREP